jgi:hypothetical protein
LILSLNDLRLVEPECLILHEAHDEKRLARLRDRIEAEGEQRNPVIVSPYEDRYLVLDGAHRVRVLAEFGYGLVLVQVVEPPDRAESWGHLLRGVGPDELRAVEGIETFEEPGAVPLAELETADGETLFLVSEGDGLPVWVRALWELQSLYPNGEVVRRVEPDGTVRLADGEALIRYRSFTPGELAAIVDAGAVLPAGITRFLVRERVLGVRYPLDRMKGGDAAARNAELREYVLRRWNEDRVRYYGEPVVLFE